MSSEIIEYCICRRNNADGFMICCDKCNEWFHGECIGLNEDMGLLYDVYYCIACKKKNAKLKSTFKTPPIAAASLSIHTGVVLPNKLDKVKVPISPERRFVREEETKQKPEPQQEIVATSEQSSGSPTIENSVEVPMPVVSIENKVHEREKVVKGESKGCQCNLYLESSEESKKRPKCWGYMCDEIARPKSRYCSDECGSVATVTRIFSTMQPSDNGWTLPHPIFTLPDDYNDFKRTESERIENEKWTKEQENRDKKQNESIPSSSNMSESNHDIGQTKKIKIQESLQVAQSGRNMPKERRNESLPQNYLKKSKVNEADNMSFKTQLKHKTKSMSPTKSSSNDQNELKRSSTFYEEDSSKHCYFPLKRCRFGKENPKKSHKLSDENHSNFLRIRDSRQ